MDLKENTKRFLAKINDFWHNLSVKKKFCRSVSHYL